MSKLDISKENGHHAVLASFIGNWKGVCKTWFEKDVLADESEMTGKTELILDGRFLNYTYDSTLQGKPFSGIMLVGYDLENAICQASWVDSFHTGTAILFSTGAEMENGFSVLCSYGGPGIPEPWGWRTEITLEEDTLIFRAFNISPEGAEALATETIYHRIP